MRKLSCTFPKMVGKGDAFSHPVNFARPSVPGMTCYVLLQAPSLRGPQAIMVLLALRSVFEGCWIDSAVVDRASILFIFNVQIARLVHTMG